ncbi:hypothetical protein ACFOHP_32320, partial [Couchioplanes caeruleus subsp. azureus]|uniref:hypothetical protein n=1 Tax=Couchioplanes caeruleus TaxID=56438 RepID=UPI00360C304E
HRGVSLLGLDRESGWSDSHTTAAAPSVPALFHVEHPQHKNRVGKRTGAWLDNLARSPETQLGIEAHAGILAGQGDLLGRP